MAEGQPGSYIFTHREVVTHLIRAADVHEGRWALNISFNLGTGSLALQPGAETSPGIMAIVQSIGILRYDGPEQPGGITVDAAEVNPAQ